MKLFHRELGGEGKPPLIILHGLLGSSRNWQTAGRDLASRFHVFALDLRNHGESPHAPEQTFGLMAADVIEWMDDRKLGRASLLGHSLGGKVAMLLACRHEARVDFLCVVDMAPRAYEAKSAEMEAMLRLDLKGITYRADADKLLARVIPNPVLRKFLLTNLVRSETGEFHWQPNLPAFIAALPVLRSSPLGPQDRFQGKTLFLAGGQSSFVGKEDEALIHRHFPRASIVRLPRCGHFPHVDDRPGFVASILSFCGCHG
jgi:esterase